MFEKGDLVQFVSNGCPSNGVIQEKRKGGWYTVELPSKQLVKLRSTHLLLQSGEVAESRKVKDTPLMIYETMEAMEFPAVPPPTIYDLDAIMHAADPVQNKRDQQYLEHCRHHASYTRWVVLTDLHCASSTLDTCLEVLKVVHQAAIERNAGVLFLGDWWHHRGTIRVDLLNSVLDSLKEWEVPMVMIPGNHDQVTLGGHNHGLTPLQHAYRVERQDKSGNTHSFPGPLIFSHPTKFAGGFFIPHVRDHTIMESILQAPEAREANALFVHADVTGAYMNDLIVSMGGVAPNMFPANKPIYSGHFHKSHSVTSQNVVIDYVGSPYQTSLSESRQPKSLWVLDAANGWVCTEKIQIHIGRKHFKADTLSELLELTTTDGGQDGVVKAGDRVIVSIGQEELAESRRLSNNGEISTFDDHVKLLRHIGASVEVREVKGTALEAMNTANKIQLEEMSPETTLFSFLAEEITRETMTNNTSECLRQAGLLLIDELQTGDDATSIRDRNGKFTDLVIEEVTLQGFGPFKDKVTYPLKQRGLVLVRGTNKDGGSDSNGTGKSSLAMAALWALSGSVDPRPMSDAKVADIVNDDSSSARVSVSGTLNGKKFVISRTKTSSKTALTFFINGEDLTTQAVKETQQIIDEKLGVDPQILARTMFHGQHALNGLLEAPDAKLKEELSLIVPTDLWQNGAKLARTKGLAASKKMAELDAVIKVRDSDINSLRSRIETSLGNATIKRSEYHRQVNESEHLWGKTKIVSEGASLSEVTELVESVSMEIRSLENKVELAEVSRHQALSKIQSDIDEVGTSVAASRHDLQNHVRAVDRAAMKFELAEFTLGQLRQKWNLSTSAAPIISFPTICPTCNQSLSESGEGHSHLDLNKVVQEEMECALYAVQDTNAALQHTLQVKDQNNATFAERTQLFNALVLSLEHTQYEWSGQISDFNRKLALRRLDLAETTVQLSKTALNVQKNSIEATLDAELKVVEAMEAHCAGLQSDLHDASCALANLKRKSEEQRAMAATMGQLSDIFGARGIQTFILQNAVEVLQTISQSYLDELSDGTQRLEISLDKSDRILRRAFIRNNKGSFLERPMSSLSGGQWRRCALALTFGFADLVARRGKMRSSLLVLDEPLTHLDRLGRISVGNLLRKLLQQNGRVGDLATNSFSATTVLIILQDLAAEELEESFDRIDEVIKDGGSSFVCIDENTP